jgi:signal-transduction protein with cAMP-binding, CBS, and nucleotidyltransferase domain
MKIKKFQKGEILFLETEVMVLLNGQVHMKSHTEEVIPPKMLAKYQQGDIIGFSKADGGVSLKEETWCIANAPTEVAVFDP